MDTILTAEQVISGHNRLAFPRSHGDFIYWMERLAEDGNRWVVRRRNVTTEAKRWNFRNKSDNPYETLTPDSFHVATKVHEYGGIAYGVAGEGLAWTASPIKPFI